MKRLIPLAVLAIASHAVATFAGSGNGSQTREVTLVRGFAPVSVTGEPDMGSEPVFESAAKVAEHSILSDIVA